MAILKVGSSYLTTVMFIQWPIHLNGNYVELRAHAPPPERVVTLPSAAPLNGLVSREPALLKQLYSVSNGYPASVECRESVDATLDFSASDRVCRYVTRISASRLPSLFRMNVIREFIASLKSLHLIRRLERFEEDEIFARSIYRRGINICIRIKRFFQNFVHDEYLI